MNFYAIKVGPAATAALRLLGFAALASLWGGCATAAPTAHSAASTTSLAAATATSTAAVAASQWVLHDDFHRQWQNELVIYPVRAEVAADKKLSLVSSNGDAHSYQWLKDGAQDEIAFMADIAADGANTYRLVAGTRQTQTDLKIEDTPEAIRVFNDHTGIAIRKKLGDGQAPIAAIRLASGQWIGDSQRLGTSALQSYTASVSRRGPVLDEVLCEAKFEGDKTWRMRFRLTAGEPVVLVTESSDLGAGASWRLGLDSGFAPTRILRREPTSRNIVSAPLPKTDATLVALTPWVKWWDASNSNWVALYDDAESDLLTVGVLNPALWVNPEKVRAGTPQSVPQATLTTSEGGAVNAVFDLTGGSRCYIIASLDKSASLNMLDGKGATPEKTTIEPHRYVIKYGDFPLDRVKEYVLDWKSDAQHPRMMLNTHDLELLRAAIKPDEAAIARYRGGLSQFNFGEAIPIYLASEDEQVGRSLAKIIITMLQVKIDGFMQQTERGTLGALPQLIQDLKPMFYAIDTAWPAFTPAELQKVKAQAALIGIIVNSPDYWSPARGFNANPNMTTMVAGFQASAGALLADHPQSAQWLETGLHESKEQLQYWSDANGGWREAPHYAAVSYDYLLGAFVMARSKDNGALLYSDKMKKIAEWFAKISTPPDPHTGNFRRTPRLGNTWLNEQMGIYGVLAGLWKDRDPRFASEMQWMFQQQGSLDINGLGGGFDSFAGVRPAFIDPSIKPLKPDYKSTLFPEVGVSLRNGVDDRETQLTLIAGSFHDHYDDDSGSITLWGKGRVVAEEFGYGGGDEMVAAVHSMIEGGGRAGLMTVKSFKSTPDFDYVHGVAGGWQRQIAFVKDSDMLAPNYFVLRDTTSGHDTANWRLWLEGEVSLKSSSKATPSVTLQSVQVAGDHDIATDIALVSNGDAKTTTVNRTAKLRGVGKFGGMDVSLNALVVNLSAGQNLLTVIYPRLKTQPPPHIEVLAAGRALKITHQAGTDYVFLSDKPFTFDEDDIHFEGAGGMVKIRDGKIIAALGEGGKLTARGVVAAQ